jgi:hypothetical protein
MAIAWIYREDYTRADYLVLPLGERRNRSVIWQTLVASLALLLVSLISTITRASGLVYFAGILVPGAIFFYYSVSFKVQKSSATARKLLLASILYLPAILVLKSYGRRLKSGRGRTTQRRDREANDGSLMEVFRKEAEQENRSFIIKRALQDRGADGDTCGAWFPRIAGTHAASNPYYGIRRRQQFV